MAPGSRASASSILGQKSSFNVPIGRLLSIKRFFARRTLIKASGGSGGSASSAGEIHMARSLCSKISRSRICCDATSCWNSLIPIPGVSVSIARTQRRCQHVVNICDDDSMTKSKQPSYAPSRTPSLTRDQVSRRYHAPRGPLPRRNRDLRTAYDD